MANGQATQDPSATKVAQLAAMRPSAGADQPPTLAPAPQGDQTITSILGAISPVMPASPGANPGAGSDLDTALQRESLAQSQYGREQLAEQVRRICGMTDEETQLREKQAGIKTSYSPKFEAITGVKPLLRDVGRGALSLLASTGPGQRVEDVLYARPRHDYANLASQLQDIKNQIEGEKEIVPAAASLAYHAPMSMARGISADASKEKAGAAVTAAQAAAMNAETRKITEQHRYSLEGKLLALKEKLGQGKLSEEAKRTVVMQARNLIDQDKNNAMREISAAHMDETERTNQLKAAEDAYREQETHYMQNWFGSGPKPPTFTPKSTAPPAGGGGGSIKVTDPRGVVHTFRDQTSANNFKKAAGIK
jgi:hypothetical protein